MCAPSLLSAPFLLYPQPVPPPPPLTTFPSNPTDIAAITAEEEDEDNMEEIDPSNIVGSRTRGRNIDWNKAAEDNKGEIDDDEDEEGDDDFKGEEGDEEMGG